MKVRIGFGKVDVTPPPNGGGELGLRVLGFWYERAKRYGPIHDPLHARAMAVAAGDDVACIVSVDMIGDAVGFGERARERIHEELGIPPECVMIACTHCHTSPETIGVTGHPVAEEWLHKVADGILEAVTQAVNSLVPERLCVSEQRLEGVSVNRRAPYLTGNSGASSLDDAQLRRAVMKDDVLRLAWAQSDEGKASGVLVNFACHAVAVQTRPFISADYPGLAMAMLEERVGVSLFTNGADGDINPARRNGMEDVRWTAERVAWAARAALESPPLAAWSDVARIRGVTRRIRLPRRPMPPVAELERQRAQIEREVAAARDLDPERTPDHPGRRLYDVNEQLAVAAMPREIEAELHALEIGDWLLVGIPGEMVCALGDDIRRAARSHRVWVVGYANGYIGYVVAREAFDIGGYEVRPGRWSILAPGAGEMVRDAAVGVIRAIET